MSAKIGRPIQVSSTIPTRKRQPLNQSHRKKNVWYALTTLVLVAGGFVGWMRLGEPAPFPDRSVLGAKAAMPTEINQNFLQQVEGCLIPTAKVYGYHLDLTQGFRTVAEQNAIYAQGRTTPGDIVTNARGGDSLHNYGLAVDVIDLNKGYDVNWDRLGKIGAFCGLEHGDRGTVDLPHFQYRGGLSLEQIKAGYRPARLRLPCQLMADKKAKGEALTKADLRTCGAPTF